MGRTNPSREHILFSTTGTTVSSLGNNSHYSTLPAATLCLPGLEGEGTAVGEPGEAFSQWREPAQCRGELGRSEGPQSSQCAWDGGVRREAGQAREASGCPDQEGWALLAWEGESC